MLSFYVHIPYCIKRCGYCDFNTYTPAELQDGATLEIVSGDYIDAVVRELAAAPKDIVPTIFFGGGTPSLLPPKDLGRVIAAIKERNGLTEDCEITLEANPDSVTQEKLNEFIAVGFNRISFGMQSAKSEVLKVLDRTHNPENVSKSVDNARKAGFDNVSLDLIYGTPGETLEEWESTVKSALSYGVDHLSAYALIVEDGTKLSAKIKRGEIARTDDDLMAQMYLAVDALADKAGLPWYELSNWGRPAEHNLVYWRNQNWWGLGPGAHSHLDGVRWWNVKHPSKYSEKLATFESPMQDREVLGDKEKNEERIMLQIRLREGLSDLTPGQLKILANYPNDVEIIGNRAVLTPSGRLIADRIVRELI